MLSSFLPGRKDADTNNAMFHTITSIEQFEGFLVSHEAVLAYFSTRECHVCKVLKPKVGEMVSAHFPKMERLFAEINDMPELAARFHIFSVPTLVVFFEGREYIRKSRAFGLDELRGDISRLYGLMF